MHKIIILHFLLVLSQVTKQNTSAVISKEDFGGSSGGEKDEERESLRKLYNEVFMVLFFPSDDTEVVK